MTLFLLVLHLARAEAPAALQAVWAEEQSFRVRNEALVHLEAGDYVGARDRFEFLEARGELMPEPAYYLGLVSELQRDWEGAVHHYTRVVDAWPGTEHGKNARFRRALCYEDLGRHEESLADVKALIAMGAWRDVDRAALEIERAVNLFEKKRSGKNERSLETALREADALDANAWLRAKARVVLIDGSLDEAQTIRIEGDAKAARRLEARAEALTTAEAAIVKVAHLDEPEFALQALLRLGDAYVELHDALLAAPAPRRFGPDKTTLYEAEVARRVQVLLTKAHAYYDDGLQLAYRVGWKGPETELLRARKEALSKPSGWSSTPR